jgi:hypothetical protein
VEAKEQEAPRPKTVLDNVGEHIARTAALIHERRWEVASTWVAENAVQEAYVTQVGENGFYFHDPRFVKPTFVSWEDVDGASDLRNIKNYRRICET